MVLITLWELGGEEAVCLGLFKAIYVFWVGGPTLDLNLGLPSV